jgi:hypothetical protein
MLQVITNIIQEHQWEATPLFVLMVVWLVSIVENWDIMPTSVRSATCRLLRKIMVRYLDNCYHKLASGILLIEVTRANRTTHVEEWIMWRLNKLKRLQVLCWVCHRTAWHHELPFFFLGQRSRSHRPRSPMSSLPLHPFLCPAFLYVVSITFPLFPPALGP